MNDMKVHILGTEYEIKTHKISEDDTLKDNRWAGYCEEYNKKIVIADMTERVFFRHERRGAEQIPKAYTSA